MMRKRPLRWIIVGVVLAVGLYFVLDVIALRYLESRGAAELARTLTAEEAKVDLGDIPFLPGFITGRLSRAEVNVRGASGSGGLRVQSLNARMSGLRFSWREMFALARSVFSTRTKVSMSEPIGLVEIGQSDLEDFLQRHITDVGTVGISSSGVEVRFLEKRLKTGIEPTPDDLTEPARYLPRVTDRHIALILISMGEVPDRFAESARRVGQVINLPAVPEGLRTDVRLGAGVITVEATGHEAELEIGEGEE